MAMSPTTFSIKFFHLAFLLVNFVIYDNFPFCYNFQFKIQIKIRSVLKLFLELVGIEFYN